eukprot:14888273-Alexandrium_andersonii.AAC.1
MKWGKSARRLPGTKALTRVHFLADEAGFQLSPERAREKVWTFYADLYQSVGPRRFVPTTVQE